MDAGFEIKKDCYLLACFNCSSPLLKAAQEFIVDAHGGRFLQDKDVSVCPEQHSVWYLKEGVWPDWIQQQVDQSGWTRGRLNCTHCKSRIGAFDFVSGVQCGCPEGHECPPVQITRSKADLKRNSL